MALQTQKMAIRSSGNLPIALVLLVGGALLWLRAAQRTPSALALLPGVDGCLTVGIVGVLLALLHGIPYRTALLSVAVPIALVQLVASELAGFSFLPVLAIELTAFGLFGLPLSRLPRRRAASAPARSHHAAHARAAHPHAEHAHAAHSSPS
ncbi:hypothetical protein BE08_36445 [Sorangium cellulosum]|uniref:Uncharacterized protein n=1 Tax=Sorangium cellulosum TaxID=56 RepID=A0A150PPV6_SORCE|nr:hypothetical protein BE08_36445 [Sorangium cellulosum]